MTRVKEGQINKRKINNDENKNPFSETSVSSVAAVHSLDTLWYQILTGESCDRPGKRDVRLRLGWRRD